MSITRRVFLRNSGLAVIGTAAVPSFLARAAFGATEAGTRTKRLVVIFQRGAADGLNIVVPHAEPQYYAMRPASTFRARCDRSQRLLRPASFLAYFSRSGSSANSPLCTPPDRPTQTAPTSTRRILWSPAPPASKHRRRMAESRSAQPAADQKSAFGASPWARRFPAFSAD